LGVLVEITSVALAKAIWRTSATSTLALDGDVSLATASIARITITRHLRCRTTAPTE
jgi:hypothetical protein